MVSLPEVEARIQQELEEKMKREFGEKERRLQEEHLRKLEGEKQEKEEQLRSVCALCAIGMLVTVVTHFPVCSVSTWARNFYYLHYSSNTYIVEFDFTRE